MLNSPQSVTFKFLFVIKRFCFAMCGKKLVSVFVRSFGCSTSLADGEVLAGCLAKAGFELVDEVKAADVVVVNTCAVKGPTENRMISFLKRVPLEKKLVVAGCLPLINFGRLVKEVRFDGVVGPAFGERIVDVVGRVLKGERVVAIERRVASKPSLKLPHVRVNPLVSVVPISYGCLGSCAYCCVRFARGSLRSYRPKEIASRVSSDVREGVREVWLTSQDTACYGLDIGSNLVELLRVVCDVEGSFLVRVGMMNVRHVLPIVEKLADVYKELGGEERFERVCLRKNQGGNLFHFFHIPVQSGDNEVLARMKRGYRVEDFKRIVNILRHKLGERLTLSTDIIVGFPGETEEAFENTLSLLEEVKPDIVNVSKFFVRPRTEAEEMKPRVAHQVLKDRSRRASMLTQKLSLERNRGWIGWEGLVFIDERGTKSETWIGRNYAYKPVVVESKENLLGRFLRVKVKETYPTHLKGEIKEKQF